MSEANPALYARTMASASASSSWVFGVMWRQSCHGVYMVCSFTVLSYWSFLFAP
jgi:hypothetical protein